MSKLLTGSVFTYVLKMMTNSSKQLYTVRLFQISSRTKSETAWRRTVQVSSHGLLEERLRLKVCRCAFMQKYWNWGKSEEFCPLNCSDPICWQHWWKAFIKSPMERKINIEGRAMKILHSSHWLKFRQKSDGLNNLWAWKYTVQFKRRRLSFSKLA